MQEPLKIHDTLRKMVDNKNTNWFVYIILADDGSYYTGISIDVERRFQEHCSKAGGAKYFNGRIPLEVVYKEDGHNRSSASKREIEIKNLSRSQKQALIGQSELSSATPNIVKI